MAIFHGTNGANEITEYVVGPGVTSDPAGLTATTDGDDLIFGYGGNDSLTGGVGYDTVFGGDGDDAIWDWDGGGEFHGGAGKDTLESRGISTVYGDGGNDTIGVYAASTVYGGSGNDSVSGGYAAFGPVTVFGQGGADVIGGSGRSSPLQGDDSLYGGAGADRLSGLYGDDLLNGGSGNDTLVGDKGIDSDNDYPSADTLIGGAGDDVFSWYRIPSGDRDLIRAEYGSAPETAFEGAGVAGGDMIDLSYYGFQFSGVDGDRGRGHIYLTESGTRTVVNVNETNNEWPEWRILIADGNVRASDYTADDFLL